MKSLREFFIEQLEGAYSAEKQIVVALPKVISKVTMPELKEALSNHLRETKNQITRLDTIFSDLQVKPSASVVCEAMKGILKEGEELLAEAPSLPLDAMLIGACQKVEHYEIANYGILKSFAQYLSLDSDIIDLLQDTLDEEGKANKKLTKLAEGSFFSQGINQEAVDATSSSSKRSVKPDRSDIW